MLGKKFDELYDEHESDWIALAQEARGLIAAHMEDGRNPTVDDIKKMLLPLVEIDPDLRTFLVSKGLTQKYWVDDFTDYVLDRVYEPTLTEPEAE